MDLMDLTGGDAAFYRDLFGWAPGPGLFTVEGRVVAARTATGAPRWHPHAAVDDVAAACRTAEELGGRVVLPPGASALGTVATLADPAGAEFVVRGPGRRVDLSRGPAVFSWAELCTPDTEAARSFYHALFGWDAVDISLTMPAGRVGYTVLMAGSAEAAGLLPTYGAFGPGEPPYWLVYVETETTDEVVARAEKFGGEVLVEPFDVSGIGRIALLTGRSGETFAVMRMPAGDR